MQRIESDLSDGSTKRVGSAPSLAWMVLIALLCQLLCGQLHLHAVTDYDNDCASCQLAIETPAPPGSDQLAVAPAAARPLYPAWRQPRLLRIAITIFLPPPSHAPPAAIF